MKDSEGPVETVTRHLHKDVFCFLSDCILNNSGASSSMNKE